MADETRQTPHQHDWLLLRERDGSLHVMANASCAVCGLTPEAVANAAAIETLLAKYATALAIVRAVAWVPDEDYDEMCVFCREQPGYTNIKHTPDCPITKARALLAQKEAE